MGQPQDESPFVWLWQEIERRFGIAAATSLRAGYIAQQRQFERRKRLDRFRDQIESLQSQIANAEARGDQKEARRYRRQLEHRQAVLATDEQAEHATDTSAAVQPLAFAPGQAVVWLSRTLGIYGSHLVHERTVTPEAAEVMRVSVQRVQIRTRPARGAGRLVWVQATSLVDQPTWEAMIAAGTVQDAYQRVGRDVGSEPTT